MQLRHRQQVVQFWQQVMQLRLSEDTQPILTVAGNNDDSQVLTQIPGGSGGDNDPDHDFHIDPGDSLPFEPDTLTMEPEALLQSNTEEQWMTFQEFVQEKKTLGWSQQVIIKRWESLMEEKSIKKSDRT